jgi:flavin-dependent dehydrogenase
MYDVAIIGGGPGGSTTGSFLKKYAPDMKVIILEREKMPREHVGESQLPPILGIVHEMGAWDKVERAGFPIKLGATYTWGQTTDAWAFEFLPLKQVPDRFERPGAYEGWRRQVALQVDRAIYDHILLQHAADLGCEVREETKVKTVHRTGDRVDAIELESGERITARYYVDASGNAAVLRRALEVPTEVPTLLKNVAFYDYWTKDAWNNEPDRIITRIHIRSLGYGWIWYIPIGVDRTSIGVVCNAEWYKNCGMTPQELYDKSLANETFVAKKLEGATCRRRLVSTTDWSFVVARTYGENWFLVGEASGFADPILSAGLTLTQTGARELAYAIMELDRGEHDRNWLLERYNELQIRRVRQHMKFAEFWYSANGLFENVRDNCIRIADSSGLSLTREDAFYWLSTGGLGDDVPGQVGIGACDLSAVKQIIHRFTPGEGKWKIDGKNVFKLNLAGADETTVGYLKDGRIHRVPCYVRGERKLPVVGVQGNLIRALEKHSAVDKIIPEVMRAYAKEPKEHQQIWLNHTVQVLEVMANNYWVNCEFKKGKPALNVHTPLEGQIVYTDKVWV